MSAFVCVSALMSPTRRVTGSGLLGKPHCLIAIMKVGLAEPGKEFPSGLAWWRWNVVPVRHDDGVGRAGRRYGVRVPAAAGRALPGEVASEGDSG
jgi:hypothetical protein